MINKKKFEKEYVTQWKVERDWLFKKGIKYDFVKEIDGISTFKYKRNSELFKALYELYVELENKNN